MSPLGLNRPDLAGPWAEAPLIGELQTLHRSILRGEGTGYRRVVHESTGEYPRRGDRHGREGPVSGLGSQPAGIAHAARTSGGLNP